MRQRALIVIWFLTFPASADANLLANGGFDSDLSGWTPGVTAASWDPLDVAASPSSGSALLVGPGPLSQCIPVAGTSYSGGASVFIPSAQPPFAAGIADVHVLFFPQASCQGHTINTLLGIEAQPNPDQWGFLPISGEVPSGAASALFQLQTGNTSGAFTLHFDGATFDVVPEPRLLLLGGVAAAALLARRRAR